MLLIDGIKYQEWTPLTEDDLEKMVIEHAKDIFGEESIYFDMKLKLKSVLGANSIPDGFALVLGNSPHWHIIEVELSAHPVHDHVVSQISRFMDGIENPNNKYKIVDAIWNEVNENGLKKFQLQKAIGHLDNHKFLADLISKLPTLTVIVEKELPGLKNALNKFTYLQNSVVEFRTFTREGIGLPVHTHLFEPLYSSIAYTGETLSHPPKISEPGPEKNVIYNPKSVLEITVNNHFIKYRVFTIPKSNRLFFPGFRVPFTLETDIGEIQTYMISAREGTKMGDPNEGKYFQSGLAEWYRRHPEIKVGDRVLIGVVEPMKRYKLEIIR